MHHQLERLQIYYAEGMERKYRLHQVAAGAADKSYGVHVAKLAGIPAAVITATALV